MIEAWFVLPHVLLSNHRRTSSYETVRVFRDAKYKSSVKVMSETEVVKITPV